MLFYRSYKVNLVALSADAAYNNSDKSNTLLIHTGGDGTFHVNDNEEVCLKILL